MHFCLTGQYTPRAINSLLENPTNNRAEAARKLIESAGGKLVSFYSVPAEGPGVLTIFDVPDPSSAPAIVGIVDGLNLQEWTKGLKPRIVDKQTRA